MLNRRKSYPQDRLAIDLGAYHTRFYSATDGLLVDEPSIGALDIDHPLGGESAVVAFGHNAAERIESNPGQLRSVHPLQSDRHNDLGLSRKMLAHFLSTATRSGLIKKGPEISLVLPHQCDVNTASQLLQTCIGAGALKADYQDAAITAFLGTALDHSKPGVVIDFGATHSRLFAIADNQVQFHQTLSCGGDAIDQAIIKGLLERFDLQVSEAGAREVKHRVGAATEQSIVQHSRQSFQLNCLSLATNTNTQFRIGSETISLILQPMLQQLTHSIRLAFAAVDTHIKNHAFENGIQLCGGGALLSRIDQLVMEATDLPVVVVNRPLTCSVRGAASQMVDAVAPLELTEPV